MKGFGAAPAIYELNPFEETSVQFHKLGAVADSGDGRLFRYAKMGEAITLGYLTQGVAIDTGVVNMDVTSDAAIGAKQITFTHGATTSTANEYAEGFAVISYGTGIGQTLKISSHLAYTSGQTGAVLNLEDPIQVALDADDSLLSLYANPWNGANMGTSLVTQPTGVALNGFTSGYYGWLQTRGVCGIAADNTITAGYRVMNDANDSGKIDVSTANSYQVHEVGNAIQAGADTYVVGVYLTID